MYCSITEKSKSMKDRTKKILVISINIKEKTGGGIINKRNIDFLNTISDNVKVFYIDNTDQKANPSIFIKVIERLSGLLSGLSFAYIKDIKKEIREFNPDIIFLNQSLFGIVAKEAKMILPNVQIISFFHNVELLYFRSQFKTNPRRLSGRLNCIAAKKAESQTIYYSDYIIAMNQRDSAKIDDIYNHKVDLLLPTSFVDEGKLPYIPSATGEPLQLLFVGFNFFANRQGLEWFCREVMPHTTNAHLTIVGKDMEMEREQLQTSKVTVIGTVDDIKEYYQKADMVVSPIFTGSGMKTKTAEALMYGLPLLATTEALEGYDVDMEKIGARCDSVTDFIKYINYYFYHKNELTILSDNSRHSFAEQYDQEVVQDNFKRFMQAI